MRASEQIVALLGGANKLYYLGQQWFSNQSTGSAASAFTYHQTFAIETKGKRIRFVLLNTNTNPMTVNSGCYAFSNSAASGSARFTPSGPWAAITFGGSTGPWVIGAGAQDLPTRWVSDWMPAAMVDRTDGGTLPIGMARFCLPTGQFSIGGYSMSPWNATSGINNGRIMTIYRDVGDFASGNQASLPGTVYTNPFIAGYEVETSNRTFNFLMSGDSVAEGVINTGGGANFGNSIYWQTISALRTANPSIAIGYVNNADGGSQTSTFRTRLDRFIAAGCHYDAICHSGFSPNDGTPTLASTNSEKTRLDTLLSDFAGQKIMLLSPCPNTAAAWDATADGFRLGLRSYIAGKAAGLVTYADIESALSDGATPCRYIVGKTTDGTHPNESGATDCLPAVQPQLQALLNL